MSPARKLFLIASGAISERRPDGRESKPASGENPIRPGDVRRKGCPMSQASNPRAGAKSVPASSNKARKPLRSAERRLKELKSRLREIGDLSAAGAVLTWDQATYMPNGGAVARGRHTALLSRLAHQRRTQPTLGHLIDQLVPYGESLPPESDDACLIAVSQRDFAKAIRVPASFVERASALGAASYDAWTRARPMNDFAAMLPHLERSLQLAREYAEFFAPYRHIADPFIDDMDEGMTCASVRSLFAALRQELVPIVHAICDQSGADASLRMGGFAEGPQLEFGLAMARAFGYDIGRGRLDKTHHPFCTKFSAGDVRITTRVDELDMTESLFSTLHEAGHALYEQGVAAELADTPLGWGTSAGIHESQSRLWENLVGRSLGLWQYYYPKLRDVFADRFGEVPLETFYRAINRVERSLIRTEADEVTYNLHIIVRFDLELDLIEGKLAVKDLAEAWRARYRSDLGVTPLDDRNGCLQDVHWYGGGIGGAFQSYTIGNVLSAQFHAAALRAHPEIPEEVRNGEFGTLKAWLTKNLYRHGRKFKPDELVQRATGEAMTIRPYIAYLRGKYGDLYRLPERPSPACR
jgi:carboxypeptidase Taq